MQEASAFGAALLAGLASGFWKKEEIPALLKVAGSYEPKMEKDKVDKFCGEWKRAVAASIGN